MHSCPWPIFYTLLQVTVLGLSIVDAQRFTQAYLSMSPAHFEKILMSKTPFMMSGDGNDKEERLLDKFRIFILTFDFSNESDESYIQLKRIVFAVAKYNKEPLRNGRITIWISLIPQHNISQQIKLLEPILNYPNPHISTSVSAIFLNYRYLRLDSQTLPQVNMDTQIMKAELQNAGHMMFGIILDGRNCYGSNLHINNLALRNFTFLAFVTNDFGKGSYVFDLNTRYACTLKVHQMESKGLSQFLYGFRYPHSSKLDLGNQTLSFSRKQFESYVQSNQTRNLNAGVFIIIEAASGRLQRNWTTDPVMATTATQMEWLGRDFKFNSKFTGISAYSSYQHLDALPMVPSVLSAFCKVMVHQREPLGEANTQPLYQFVDKLFEYRNNTECGDSSLQIFLAVRLYQNVTGLRFVETNINVVASIVTIAHAMVSKYSTVPPAIVFNSNNCFDKESCAVAYTGDVQKLGNLLPITKLTRHMIAHLKFETKPRLGVMVDWHICLQFSTVPDELPAVYLSEFDDTDFGVFKIHIHKNTIMEQGALQISTEIISNLTLCSSFLQLRSVPIVNNVRASKDIELFYHVIIFGCESSASDYKELREVARFWEFVSLWAVSVQTTVFIGFAVEDGTKVTQASHKLNACIINHIMDAREDCDCGWWRAIPPDEHPTLPTGSMKLESRKSIALKLIQESVAANSTSNSTQDLKYDSATLIKVMVPITMLAALVLSTTVVLTLRYRQKDRLSDKELQHFFRGHKRTGQDESRSNDSCSTAESLPYRKDRFELSLSTFTIDTSVKSLGTGEFCSVHRATVKKEYVVLEVAVKMMRKREGGKSHGNFVALRGLLSEIKILSYVGDHQHIVKFIGACTEKLKRGKLFVLLEHCELGSLLNYLRGSKMTNSVERPEAELVGESGSRLNMDLDDSPTIVTVEDLERWSKEIANGMEFLHSKKMVHADLAARNVLLNSQKCTKISDFGLSRRLYDYSEYIKREAGPLPWKWMAPESLRKLIFNEKSDVWAFGVTLWEIFTLGDEPYPGLSWETNFPALLETGTRLEEPRYNDGNIYSVMKRCWNNHPGDRPNFSEIRALLE